MENPPSPVDRKSLGTLIDELITTSNRMWHMQDAIMAAEDKEAGKMAKQLQRLNARRSSLINAIDVRIGEGNTQALKTYEGL